MPINFNGQPFPQPKESFIMAVQTPFQRRAASETEVPVTFFLRSGNPGLCKQRIALNCRIGGEFWLLKLTPL